MMKSRTLALGAFALACALTAQPATADYLFSNTNPITINSSGPATPYASTIEVAGLPGPITNVTASIFGFSHTWPEDVGVLLVGPQGQTVVLFNGVGDGTPAVNLDFTFSDSASDFLPPGGELSSGTYLPTNYYPGDVFDPPAPAGPYGDELAAFIGTEGNGTWTLFVYDFVGGDGGEISGGWELRISAVPEPSSIALCGLGLVGLAGIAARRRRRAA